MSVDAVLARIDQDLDKSLERLFELLRIPSISTDPAYRDSCRAAADWLAAELTGLGFDASVRPTDGQPMVVAHYPSRDTANDGRVLFYGHYDVQPVDPLELWNTQPFEPAIVTRDDGSKMIVARGAADDKGQLMTFVEAARAWVAETGGLPVPVTILFEGEEESGSPSLAPFLNAHMDELKADAAFVCDTGMWDRQTPAISTSLRGLVTGELTITAADKDLHSGLFGGAARNPNHVLAKILSDLHDDQGRVQIPGFYDGVPEVPAEVKAAWDALDFSDEEFLGQVGLKKPAGEADRSALEQIWARPTAEVNGMIGGYTGAGFKTVIPAQASAKVSFRLVGSQDPAKIVDAFHAFVRERLPADCSVSFTSHGASPALSIPADSPVLQKGREALRAEWDVEPLMIGMGGSIPIVGAFRDKLGMDTLLMGFGLDDDRIHSPNEKYEKTSFHKGIRSWARMLGLLAN
ncbi:dipeptidase [Amorphus orientalis]|uniref:Acetylornithine deacetylase/succinyl-diaminopimelate desuccinylase-like protein n=1 Tax=Amorphus orientalis TaxID=649198 RepID=A0AAE4AUD9_9HYPH|nr:dipeptidase [Amorphus orientalis]MDQ0317323.1 acetylornithine deacetylase/succinyl-diaminopimelate desuccinylase-like protein [Amorphus orientalis]